MPTALDGAVGSLCWCYYLTSTPSLSPLVFESSEWGVGVESYIIIIYFTFQIQIINYKYAFGSIDYTGRCPHKL